jgi:hypothetical protein
VRTTDTLRARYIAALEQTASFSSAALAVGSRSDRTWRDLRARDREFREECEDALERFAARLQVELVRRGFDADEPSTVLLALARRFCPGMGDKLEVTSAPAGATTDAILEEGILGPARWRVVQETRAAATPELRARGVKKLTLLSLHEAGNLAEHLRRTPAVAEEIEILAELGLDRAGNPRAA